MNKYLIGLSVIVLIFVAVAGFVYFTPQPDVVQSQQVLKFAGSDTSDEGGPSTLSIIGDREEIFDIWCDNEQSYGLINQEFYCRTIYQIYYLYLQKHQVLMVHLHHLYLLQQTSILVVIEQ